ncbi:MAG: 6-phosphofructokinase, partial [Phycisphaerae bacterium]|nr:6-phosphofructokinase [Phycisphaerae bacterium]
DNDLRKTDHCPGYGSAARFVASAFMGDDRDIAALPGIKINVVMGRCAGWLTAASVLGRQDKSDGPHLVYVPEIPFSLARFIRDVKKVYERLGRCQVAVSEGIVDRANTPIAEVLALKLGKKVVRDDYGHMQLSGTSVLGDFLGDYVKKVLGRKKKTTGKGSEDKKPKKPEKELRVRADTFGYLQRSFAGYASSVDQAEARMAGRKAAELALSGDVDGSVVFKRVKGSRYAVRCTRTELKNVARHTRMLPRNYINKAGNGMTEAFRKYAMPLVGGLPVIGKLM